MPTGQRISEQDKLRFASLLEYVQTKGVCPMPNRWHELWLMLPDRRQVDSGGWVPAVPLILGGWWDTPPSIKFDRLRDHIGWAAEHGVLDEVDRFLRGLSDDEWSDGYGKAHRPSNPTGG